MSARPLVVLACESLHVCTVCIWRCEHARFCVDFFLCAIYKFSFIHSSLPILMHESFWWWQCGDRYIISLSPHLHTPFPTFSPSLICLVVSVDVKHHVYLLTLLLTSRAYLWTTSRVSLTRVAHQESNLLIWLRLSARWVNRDKDLVATTDAHHQPVRVHAQRPGKGLQAKQRERESMRAQDSATQKPDQNRNGMSHSLYNHAYALDHIIKGTFDNYESQHLQSVSHDIPPISCRKIDR